MFTIFANQIELSLHEVTAMNGIEHFMNYVRSIDVRKCWDSSLSYWRCTYIFLVEFFPFKKCIRWIYIYFTIQSVHCFSIHICLECLKNCYYCHGNERWPMANAQSVQSPHISTILRCYYYQSNLLAEASAVAKHSYL